MNGIEQKRNVIAAEIQVALVYFAHPRQFVKVLDEPAFRIVNDGAVFAVADTGNVRQRRSLGECGDLMVELAADNEVDGRLGKRFLRLHCDGRPTKATFNFGLLSFIISAILTSTWKPGVEVNSTRSSKSLAIATVCSMLIPWGGASTTLLSGIMPAG
jgi:hypothetical protein